MQVSCLRVVLPSYSPNAGAPSAGDETRAMDDLRASAMRFRSLLLAPEAVGFSGVVRWV